jgi:diphosphomevalonate decarboxylase
MPAPQDNAMGSIERFVKAKAPVNIAVIKYWGKNNAKLKTPLNDSLSGTLNIDDMCTTTSVSLSSANKEDKLILNGEEQHLSETSPVTKMLHDIRSQVKESDKLPLLNFKAHIVTDNNFPTAAGLASSAAGYACLAFALGHVYGVTDLVQLSKIARNGSGSACRSLFGGFVHWIRGTDHETSFAQQVVDHLHWPEMRVIICVVNDSKKDVSSSLGMAQSVETSPLIKFRAESVVPQRINKIKEAILNKDFETFANITMQDSNQFHAICLDTFPPIFYLNETSRAIIRICHLINAFFSATKVAYTFDAGPNACIYLLEDFVPTFIEIINRFFPNQDDRGVLSNLAIKGRAFERISPSNHKPVVEHIEKSNVAQMPNSIKYLINTSIGGGPQLVSTDPVENVKNNHD